MKLPTFIIAILTCTAVAQPFVIVSTKVQYLVPTPILERRQGLLDQLQSAVEDAFGDDDSTSTVTPSATKVSASKVTLPAPVTAPQTEDEEEPATTVSPSSNDDDDDSDSSTEETSTTRNSHTTAKTSSTTLTSTSESTTATPAPTPTPALGTAAPTASASASNSDDDKGGVPAGGVAVAVIMVLLILAVTAFLVFKYHPRCQAWWAVRQEKARFERSYREAIDGTGNTTLRQQALAGDGVGRRRTMLQSFFAPATVRLSETSEIRRKPVNWGEPSSTKVPDSPMARDFDSEKIPMTASAAPLGQIERYSIFPATSPVPPMPPPPQPRASIASRAESLMAPPVVSPTLQINRSPQPPQTPQFQAQGAMHNEHARAMSTAPQIPVNAPVSPMSLMPVTPSSTKRSSLDRIPPISPMSTYQREPMESIAEMSANPEPSRNRGEPPLPALPPVPAMPGLVHAKRGSDGVFRLA